MALAGKNLLLKSAATATPTNTVDGVRTVSLNRPKDIIDITVFGTTSGVSYRKKLAGLQDGTIDIGGVYLPSDTGQALFETQFNNDGALFLRIAYDGTNGDEIETLVENFNIDADVTRETQFSTSLSRNGAITAF